MDQRAKVAVPKFTSFRPKSLLPTLHREPSPNSEKERTRPEAQPDNRRQHHRSSHGHRGRHGRISGIDCHRFHRGRDSTGGGRHEQGHGDDFSTHVRYCVGADTGREIRRPPENGYMSDYKGDVANLRYRRLHQYSVPYYHRAGRGSVLGLPSHAKIDRVASDDLSIVIDMRGWHGGSERRLLSKRVLGNKAPILCLPQCSKGETVDNCGLGQDFIPIPRQQSNWPTEQLETEGWLIDDRSIDANSNNSWKPDDSDKQYTVAHPNKTFTSEATEKYVRLTRKIQEHPDDIQAWLDVVEHQESMIRIGLSDVHRQLKASELHALSSLRYDVYQRACQAVQSERLTAGLMEESSKIHQREEHFGRWKNVLSVNPSSTFLWIKYLDALQTNLAEFHFEMCRCRYLECLEAISLFRTAESQQLRMYIFLRLTFLIRQAGYQERAIALWQALLEMQLFRPLYGGIMSKTTVLQDFERFWDSECPRIGEPDAAGWANAQQTGRFPHPPEIAIPKCDDDDHCSQSPFDTFSRMEYRRMSALRWPGRTTDEAGEDDPFHVVLFSDIKAELESLIEPIPPSLLCEAYVCFWGLPPVQSELPTFIWWLDPFLRDRVLRVSGYHDLSASATNPDVIPFHDLNIRTERTEHFQVTVDDLFGGKVFSGIGHHETEWLRNSLKALARIIPEDAFAEYYLAFEWHCNQSAASKVGKLLLKERSTSLRLYNAHALMESRSGRPESADRVFSTALGLSDRLPVPARKFKILLWRTWIWEALRVGNARNARTRLCLIASAKLKPEMNFVTDAGNTLRPATALKIRIALIEGRDYSLSNGDALLAAYYSECLALLAYMQGGRDIEAAIETFGAASTLLQSRGLAGSAANEVVHQLQCQLLLHHAGQVKLFKPGITRSAIQKSIRLFPNNTKFLVMYAETESRFRVDDRVREIIQNVVLQKSEQSIVGWLFAIDTELRRGEKLGSTTHAVRAVFERAIRSESSKRSTSLWISYVAYLCSVRDLHAAKEVFFRGLLHLPYSKSYIMLAFEDLTDIMGFRELNSLYNTLQEKGLRLYVDIEADVEALQQTINGQRRYPEGV